VSVVDTTPPKLDLPGNLTFTAAVDPRRHALGATVNFVAGAVDAVDPEPRLTCSIPTGTFIATDQAIVSDHQLHGGRRTRKQDVRQLQRHDRDAGPSSNSIPTYNSASHPSDTSHAGDCTSTSTSRPVTSTRIV
jgi:hypothetical protein